MDIEQIAREGVKHKIDSLLEEVRGLKSWLKATKKKKFFAGINIEGASAERMNGKVTRHAVAEAEEEPKKRKRQPMTASQRRALSKRMKLYWAGRRAEK